MSRPRLQQIDLDDDEVFAVLETHVEASHLTVAELFKYKKTKHSQSASWKCLMIWKLMLYDFIVLTKGKLLNFAKLERQLTTFTDKYAPGIFNPDTISVVGKRSDKKPDKLKTILSLYHFVSC